MFRYSGFLITNRYIFVQQLFLIVRIMTTGGEPEEKGHKLNGSRLNIHIPTCSFLVHIAKGMMMTGICGYCVSRLQIAYMFLIITKCLNINTFSFNKTRFRPPGGNPPGSLIFAKGVNLNFFKGFPNTHTLKTQILNK